MKILIVTHDSNFSGGANRSLLMVLRNLKTKYNVEIEVLLPKKSGELNNRLTSEGIKWFSIPYFGVVSSIRQDGKDSLRHLKVIFGYVLESIEAFFLSIVLRKKKYDIIYTNTRLPIIGAKLANHLNLPHVIHVREFLGEQPILGKWGYESIYNLSDKVILISNALQERYSNYVPTDKLITIHNGIDRVGTQELVKILECKTIQIIQTARLVPDKGHKDILIALKILLDNGKDNFHLNIVGSSPKRSHISWYENELKEYVKNNNMEHVVTFHGEISDVPNFRKNMDIEVVCSIRETFGRVTVEAMQQGLLVIGSNTGGTLEIINNNVNGVLYTQGDSVNLSSILEEVDLSREKYRRIGFEAYCFSKEYFTPEKNVQEIYGVLEEVLDERK